MSGINFLLFSTLTCLVIAGAFEYTEEDYRECTISTDVEALHRKVCELSMLMDYFNIKWQLFGNKEWIDSDRLPTREANIVISAPIQKRKNEFIRFGKRKNEFIRFGRFNGGAADDSHFVAKRKNEFIRFG